MNKCLMIFGTLLFFALMGFAKNAELPPPVRIDSGVSGHIHPALAITKKGTLVAVYCKSEAKPYLITRSTDGGKSWSRPEPFPHTVKDRVYPGSLTTLADGRLVHASPLVGEGLPVHSRDSLRAPERFSLPENAGTEITPEDGTALVATHAHMIDRPRQPKPD